MVTIARIEFGPGVFLLGRVFERFPGATVELERIVPTDERMIPYFWVRGIDREDVESLSGTLPEEVVVVLVDSVDGEHLVRATWDPASRQGILSGLAETELTLVSALGTDEKWQFELRADDHESITRFQSYCHDRGIPLRLVGLHALEPVREPGYGLRQAARGAAACVRARLLRLPADGDAGGGRRGTRHHQTGARVPAQAGDPTPRGGDARRRASVSR